MLKWIKSKIKQRSCVHRTAKIYITSIIKEAYGDTEVYKVEMDCDNCGKKIGEFWETSKQNREFMKARI